MCLNHHYFEKKTLADFARAAQYNILTKVDNHDLLIKEWPNPVILFTVGIPRNLAASEP